jgi:hypothetical protein
MREKAAPVRPALQFLGCRFSLLAIACAGLAACGSGDDTVVLLPPDGGDAATSDASAHDASVGDASVRDGLAGETGAADAQGAARPDATVTSQDGGAASVSFSTTAVDFAGVSCGLSSQRTLTVQNLGTGQLSVQASVTGTAFAIAANTPSSLSIAPGSSGTLSLVASFPTTSSAGVVAVGSLNLFTNDVNDTKVAIRLTATSTGATLAFQQAGMTAGTPIGLPTTKTGTPVSGSFTIVNSGNAPVNFTVSAPSSTSFSLGQGSDAGIGVSLAPVSTGAAWTGNAVFTPTTDGAQMATSTIITTDAICGNSLSSVTFDGNSTSGAITGYPTSTLAFAASCGSGVPPMPQTITLRNTGSVVANITNAVIAPASTFTDDLPASPRPLPIAPNGGTLTIHVSASPFAAGTIAGVMPQSIAGSLTLSTDVAASPSITVALSEVGSGAVLSLAQPAGFSVFSPPSVPVLQAGASHPFNVVNIGNAPANVSVLVSNDPFLDAVAPDAASDASVAGVPTPFSVSGPASLTVAAGGTAPDSILFSPVVAGPNAAYLGVLADPLTLCAPPPAVVPLTGTGIGGGPSLTATSLTFPAPCDGTTVPGAQTLVITNTGDRDMTWAMSPLTGPGAAVYTTPTASPAPGVLFPGASSTITAGIRQPMARAPAGGAPTPGALAAQLVVTTDVPFDSPHVIALDEVPVGDRLSASVGSLAFGQVPLAATTLPLSFTVTNGAATAQGSQSAGFSFVPSNASYSAAPASLSVAPGATSAPIGVTFAPVSNGSLPATLTIARNDPSAPLCAPLPPPLVLSGTGTQGLPAVSASELDYGLVDCGTTAAAQGFMITNNGNQPFNVVSVGFDKTISPFAPPVPNPQPSIPTPVGIGTTIAMFVTPKPIPAPPTVVDPNDTDAFSDTLTVTTDAVGDTPHRIRLVMQPHGAVIVGTQLAPAWSFGEVPFGSVGTVTSTIQNTGNATASVSLAGVSQPTIAQPAIFGLADDPTTAVANDVTSIVGRFAPPTANGSWTDQGVLVLTAPVLCAPLPAIWQAGATATQWQTAPFAISGSSPSTAGLPPITTSGDLAFPATDCGSAPPAPRTIVLTNNSNQDYAFSANLQFGAHYTLAIGGVADAGGGTLPGNGGAVTISVAPQAVIPGPGVLSGSAPYADNLLVNIGNPPTSPVVSFNFAVSWSLNGAVLSLPAGGGDHVINGVRYFVADSTSGLVLPMNNTGNQTAFVDFAIPPAADFTVTPTPPLAVLPGVGALPRLSSTAGAASCTLSPSGPNTSVIFAYPPGSAICQPFSAASVRILSCAGTSN